MRKIERTATWIRNIVSVHLSSDKFYEALGITWFPEISEHAINSFAIIPDMEILEIYKFVKEICPVEVIETIEDDEPNYVHIQMALNAYKLSKNCLFL